MDLSHREIALAFEAMSDGDKSCLLHLMQLDGGQQMTTTDSAHNRFYECIAQIGWAKPAEADPNLAEIGLFAFWELTEKGREELPGFIAGVQAQRNGQN